MATLQVDQALADQITDQAVAFCAAKKFAGNALQARQALSQGRCDACSLVSESLVRQVGETLGHLDHSVRAVYSYESEAGGWRTREGDAAGTLHRSGINLVTWVDRKSPALNALGASLESALAESRKRFNCPNAGPACYTLDVQMVDSRDVLERRGYGALVNNMYVRSTAVWVRPDIAEAGLPATRALGGHLDLQAPIDPELTPESVLFEQAFAIEKLPPAERQSLEHRLREIKVLLIRRMISDQLAYIQIAKQWFTVGDLYEIYQRKIGYGKIGGKTAGMLLAARILNEVADDEIRRCLVVPESYFIGSDGVYLFMAMNGLMHWNEQKYKPEEQILAEYPLIKEQFEAGAFPPEVVRELQQVLAQTRGKPLIVRSSSQLEDNFGTAFAGKYDSHFCPNQGTPEQNLADLTLAIARTYASTLKPEALLYRRRKGLQDYDERMAILIQVVQGETYGHYYLPHGAGVAFSRNIYRWAPEIRREAGFARLVWGLGTRAVERVGNEYPRLVALSHPTLQPDDSCEAIRHYSQQYVDLIDLQANQLKTLPVAQVLQPGYPALRYIAQLEQDGYFTTPRSRVLESEMPALAITYDELLRRTAFAALLSRLLHLLEDNYHGAVDVEFTVQVTEPRSLQPGVKISLLQCRPQSYLLGEAAVQLPAQVAEADLVFDTHFTVPQGCLSGIRYVLFISPEAYFALPTPQQRRGLAGQIHRINTALAGQPFICVGPGRWGTVNTDLGVYVSYADICNARALVELAGKGIGPAPEPSLGTHFFQDLMEAQIYPVAICFDHPATRFNRGFFYDSPSCLAEILPDEPGDVIRLIDVQRYKPGHSLSLVMDDEHNRAIAHLVPSN